MIKIKLRKNSLVLFIYLIAWILYLFFKEIFRYSDYFNFYLYPINVAKIPVGLILYLYQNHLLKNNKQSKNFIINLIYKERKTRKDSRTKIGFLLFLASFFYVFRFIAADQFIINKNSSPSIELRLSSMQTVSASLICTYALGFEIKKHHKISLIIISIFLILMFIVDIIYKSLNTTLDKFVYFNLFILYYHICETFSSCIEKYLVDINHISPFLILLLEGIFELLVSFYIIFHNNNFLIGLKDLLDTSKNNIILNFIFFILISMMENVSKIVCNIFCSPMARSLINYLLNPLYIIYSFIVLKDFNKNILYLIISIILCIVISFFGCVYNEYIILFCCGLEQEAKDIISERPKSVENLPGDIIYLSYNRNVSDSDSDSDDDNEKR